MSHLNFPNCRRLVSDRIPTIFYQFCRRRYVRTVTVDCYVNIWKRFHFVCENLSYMGVNEQFSGRIFVERRHYVVSNLVENGRKYYLQWVATNLCSLTFAKDTFEVGELERTKAWKSDNRNTIWQRVRILRSNLIQWKLQSTNHFEINQ